MSVIINGTDGVQFNDSSLQGAAASPFGLKNRIINGDMRIDQRNAGASVTANTDVFPVDRFKISTGYTSKATIQQSTTVPAGFNNSVLLTSSAATSTGSGDYMTFNQLIEGYNIADLNWGSANAKTVTFSFWVRSSLTGTFGGAINNNGSTRSYVFTYTISAANTWEQKTITIAGDTTGTWNTTNSAGMIVRFSIAMGSTYSTASTNTWLAGDYEGATGQTQILNTNGATFYITGVQLEVGSTATPFERRLYDKELVSCQRYYEKSYNVNVVPGTSTMTGIIGGGGVQGATSTQEVDGGTSFKVTKRTTPTIAYWDDIGTSGKCNRVQLGITGNTNSLIALNSAGENSFFVYSSGGATASAIWFHYTATAEL